MNRIKRVSVYCASSTAVDRTYFDDARELGQLVAAGGMELVYGGGSVGLMGAVADAVKAGGGRATGVIPHFMVEREWLRGGLDRVIETDTMSERKRIMADLGDAAVALPGGPGTFDELMEIIALKKLGLYRKPIAVLNTRGYYDPLVELLRRSMEEHFMSERYRSRLICVATTPAEVMDMILNEPPYDEPVDEYVVI